MSTTRSEQSNLHARPGDGSRSVRWRLWAAMLGLALVPSVGGIFLTSSLIGDGGPSITTERARDAAASAADLLSREQAIESRLLLTAAEPGMGRIANGIDGPADRQFATQVLRELRGSDGDIVRGACVIRASDGGRVVISPGQAGGTGVQCAGDDLARRTLDADTATVTRVVLSGDEGAGRLIIATPLRSVGERNSGVISAEIDVAALFDRTRLTGGDTVPSVLVDMGSSEVIATTTTMAGPAGGAEAVTIEAIEPHIAGILAQDGVASGHVAELGVAPTVVPLWGDGSGAAMGLVQLWPTDGGLPLELKVALLAIVIGATFAAVLLARYFLDPFEEMADSRAQLQVLYREAREDALNDALTGLGNHRSFQEELARQTDTFEKRGTSFSVVLMDLDDLKVVNDRDGHAAGDEMLKSMAETMREMADEYDHLFRTGGDEFAMILPSQTIDEAVAKAGRILHFGRRPSSGARPSPFSSGVSGVPYFTRQRDMVYRQADAALYWAKRHGRGSVEVFDSERDQLPDEITDVTGNAVREVLAGRLLRPVYQPIVDLRTGHVLGFEGLIRPDPNGPLPDADRLFAAAAASGRTVELDRACIEAVVNGARAIGPDRLLTLNLSPRTLEVKDFDAGWLLSGLVRNGISPSRVIVEMTEREEVDDLARLRQTFAALQQYGLRLAADDVGAGNSGLRLLSQVQFDIVKIDLALVQDGVRRIGARAVLQSLRDLALSQQARIVAEGVETPHQLQVIRELNIGAGQGYLLGRPDVSMELTFVDVQQLLEPGVSLQGRAMHAAEALAADTSERRDPAGGPEARPLVPPIVIAPPMIGGLLEAGPGAA